MPKRQEPDLLHTNDIFLCGTAWVIKDFFNSDGSLRQLPMQRKKFGAVLKHIVQDIEPGREYTEKQINALLKRRHPDTASLRRGMIDFRLMERKSGVYWRL